MRPRFRNQPYSNCNLSSTTVIRLNPYRGNPALRPAYQQSWRVNFTSFDPGTFIGFFAFVDVDYTTNAITNAVNNDNFVRTTMPVNVKDNMRVNGDATFSFPLTKLKSRVNLSANVREEHGVNVIDEAHIQFNNELWAAIYDTATATRIFLICR